MTNKSNDSIEFYRDIIMKEEFKDRLTLTAMRKRLKDESVLFLFDISIDGAAGALRNFDFVSPLAAKEARALEQTRKDVETLLEITARNKALAAHCGIPKLKLLKLKSWFEQDAYYRSGHRGRCRGYPAFRDEFIDRLIKALAICNGASNKKYNISFNEFCRYAQSILDRVVLPLAGESLARALRANKKVKESWIHINGTSAIIV